MSGLQHSKLSWETVECVTRTKFSSQEPWKNRRNTSAVVIWSLPGPDSFQTPWSPVCTHRPSPSFPKSCCLLRAPPSMSRRVRDLLLVSALSLKINRLKPGRKLKDEGHPMTKVCSYPGHCSQDQSRAATVYPSTHISLELQSR